MKRFYFTAYTYVDDEKQSHRHTKECCLNGDIKNHELLYLYIIFFLPVLPLIVLSTVRYKLRRGGPYIR